ncbi:hypothetical protein [Helicobacter canis]|uniref:hypothetical protein n=1 Tax=Helicobacter canis TaxID=29419 RepID=UPI0015F0F2AA|nr:hypothetical protein [Helicobacter canis]
MDSRAARKAAMSKVDSSLESTFETTQTLHEHKGLKTAQNVLCSQVNRQQQKWILG